MKISVFLSCNIQQLLLPVHENRTHSLSGFLKTNSLWWSKVMFSLGCIDIAHETWTISAKILYFFMDTGASYVLHGFS